MTQIPGGYISSRLAANRYQQERLLGPIHPVKGDSLCSGRVSILNLNGGVLLSGMDVSLSGFFTADEGGIWLVPLRRSPLGVNELPGEPPYPILYVERHGNRVGPRLVWNAAPWNDYNSLSPTAD